MKMALINIDKLLTKESQTANREVGYLSMTIYDQVLGCLNEDYLHLAPKIQEIMSDSLSYFLEGFRGNSDMNLRKFWHKD